MDATITELYDAHERGELTEHDARWKTVCKHLGRIAAATVAGSSKGLYGEPFNTAVMAVETELLRKFIKKKFGGRSQDTIDSLLGTTARNDLYAHFRRSKSPTPVYFDGAEETWESPKSTPEHEHDIFGEVRKMMRPVRFVEYPHAKEIVLAAFLATGKMPDSRVLELAGVKKTERQAVLNSIIFSINNAMMGLCSAA
jgi:hypothetical protein